MMRSTTPAIVLSLRPHGEHGAVVRMMTPEHGLQAAYVRGARGPADAAGADGRQPGRGGAVGADRGAIAAGDGRTAAQPRAVAGRAVAGGGDRLGDGADRDRAARGPALSAICTTRSTGCWRRSRRRRRRAGGGRRWCAMNCCCWPNWASGSTSTVRGERRTMTTWSRSARDRAGRSARPRPSPIAAIAAAAALRRARAGAASWAEIVDGLALTGHFLLRDLLTDRATPVAEARAPAGRSLAPRGGTWPSVARMSSRPTPWPCCSPMSRPRATSRCGSRCRYPARTERAAGRPLVLVLSCPDRE